MMMHCGLLRQALINVLKNAGAKRYDVYRTPKDANDQPMGEAVKVASIFGLYHKKQAQGGQGGHLHIEAAGIILSSAPEPQITCVKVQGEEPEAGDVIHAEGKALEIIDAAKNNHAYVLRVREVVKK